MNRHEFHRGNAKVFDIIDNLLGRESRKSAAKIWRNPWMKLGETFDVHLIENRPFPRYSRRTIAGPGESRIDYATFRNEAAAISLIEGYVIPFRTTFVAEHIITPFK